MRLGGGGTLLEQESEVYFGSEEKREKTKGGCVKPRRICEAVCTKKGGGSAAAYLGCLV